jgi:putative FmdB family regulatory protein
MPLYGVKCNKCGSEEDVYLPLSRFDDLPICCGEKMERQLSAPMVIADIQPYQSMATGEMITSRSQHREHLKAHGLIEVGNEKPQPKKSFTQDKKQKEALRSEIAARLDTAKRG